MIRWTKEAEIMTAQIAAATIPRRIKRTRSFIEYSIADCDTKQTARPSWVLCATPHGKICAFGHSSNIPHPAQALNKLYAYLNFLAPHHTARAARLVMIEDKLKDAWDWAGNDYLGPFFGKITNDALHGDTIRPNNLRTF